MNYIFVICIAAIALSSPGNTIPALQNEEVDHCLSADEMELYRLINQYRKKKKLHPIPLSASLSYVARQHCLDLIENKPDLKSRCNPHSWSDKGPWTSCCYTSSHRQAECMWNKPAELTSYPASGFEIITTMFWSNNRDYQIKPEEALDNWKSSSPHHAVIINRSNWKKSKWEAIGVGMYKGHAIAWFGMVTDPAGEPGLCK